MHGHAVGLAADGEMLDEHPVAVVEDPCVLGLVVDVEIEFVVGRVVALRADARDELDRAIVVVEHRARLRRFLRAGVPHVRAVFGRSLRLLVVDDDRRERRRAERVGRLDDGAAVFVFFARVDDDVVVAEGARLPNPIGALVVDIVRVVPRFERARRLRLGRRDRGELDLVGDHVDGDMREADRRGLALLDDAPGDRRAGDLGRRTVGIALRALVLGRLVVDELERA